MVPFMYIKTPIKYVDKMAFHDALPGTEYTCIQQTLGFPAQSIRSSNAIALDSPYLLVLITRTSQSRQHVDTSLIHVESRKSPTAELFDVDSGRISIHHCEY
ncbi:hypothetical protein Tco_1105710 [Tanacetum coccineum]